MKKLSLLLLTFLLVIHFQAFSDDSLFTLNKTFKMKNIPAFITIPKPEEQEVSILKVEPGVENNKVKFILTLDKPLPSQRMIVLYIDFDDEFGVFIYDAKKYFYAASKSAALGIIRGKNEKVSLGYQILNENTLQCEANI